MGLNKKLIFLKIYFKTLFNLGINNFLKVIIYRFLVTSNFYKTFNKRYDCPKPEKININNLNLRKFDHKNKKEILEELIFKAESILKGNLFWYGSEKYFVGRNINWFLDYKNNVFFQDSNFHWSECNYFLKGDIKECWEISRWNWAPILIRASLLTGEKKYISYLNLLIEDWCKSNPVNCGVNWFCGQEISIRLINALITWKLVDNHNDNHYPDLLINRVEFVAAHLKRICQTRFYARAQNNNHWITESAALYIGGSWLMKNKNKYSKKAIYWSYIGREQLEKSIKSLVLNDGSFSQHSLTYHRFVLDTLSQVEIWRRSLKLSKFSLKYQIKFSALIEWLYYFCGKCGNGPNLGANDGTFCFQLHELPFRDFRPTLQLSSALDESNKNLLFDSGKWDQPLIWFDLGKKFSNYKYRSSRIFPNGGYIVICPDSSSWGLFRLPKYFVRPSQNDPLHFDLWNNGINLLRDGGSFSYNSTSNFQDYFNGIESHNSIEFVGSKQMIKISRFLLGSKICFKNDLKVEKTKNSIAYIAYYSFEENYHRRKVFKDTKKNYWEIIDNFRASNGSIILRWRLAPIQWEKITNLVFQSSKARITILSSKSIFSTNLVEGFESKYYSKKTTIPVLEVVMNQYAGQIKTKVEIL